MLHFHWSLSSDVMAVKGVKGQCFKVTNYIFLQAYIFDYLRLFGCQGEPCKHSLLLLLLLSSRNTTVTKVNKTFVILTKFNGAV